MAPLNRLDYVLSKCANNWSEDYPVSTEGFLSPPEGGLDLVTNRQGAI